MKKYNVFNLYVIEKDNYKFICEKVIDNEYKEILTNEKIIIEQNNKIEELANYYSILSLGFYKDGKILNPLMLTKKDILTKYIKLNQKVVSRLSVNDNVDDFLKRQEEELRGLKILAKECPNLAKKKAIEKLQRSGILDGEGNLIGPYKENFITEDNPKNDLKEKELIKK